MSGGQISISTMANTIIFNSKEESKLFYSTAGRFRNCREVSTGRKQTPVKNIETHAAIPLEVLHNGCSSLEKREGLP
jgi:hypothetical protein